MSPHIRYNVLKEPRPTANSKKETIAPKKPQKKKNEQKLGAFGNKLKPIVIDPTIQLEMLESKDDSPDVVLMQEQKAYE